MKLSTHPQIFPLVPTLGEPRIFRIFRFYKNGKKRTIRCFLTEIEAQNHCAQDGTRGNRWFDGYDYMKGHKPKK